MTNASATARRGHEHRLDSPRSWYVLILITLAYGLSYIDRQMLNLLVDPIKTSLHISDTAFSFIQGSAFVTAYLTALPIFGRLVDVTNRRNILIFGVCAWSVCTALCGMANSYQALFLARFGVGIAEACVFPVSMSLISESFSPKRTPRAMSVWTLGSGLGGGFSLLAGGLVIAFAGTLALSLPALHGLATWQMAFVVIGLPGLAYALLLLTIREPPRGRAGTEVSGAGRRPLREVAGTLWADRAFYARIYLSIGCVGIVTLGVPAWFPAFLIRTHGLPATQVGFRLGSVSIICGAVGTLIGPWVAERLRRRGYIDAPLRASAFSSFGTLVSCLAIPLAPGANGALAAAGGVLFFCGFPLGLIAASTQNATPNHMRGVVGALYTFSAQFIGYMIGPSLIAMLTDRWFHDPKMVGYSLQIVTSAATVAIGVFLFTILRPYRAMLERNAAATSAN